MSATVKSGLVLLLAAMLIMPACETLRGGKPVAQPGPDAESAEGYTSPVVPAPGLALAPEQRFKDVPLPIGLDEDLERSFIFESPTLQVGRVVYTSRDTIGELTQFFIQECPTAQWQLGNVIEAQGAKKLFFTKPGKRLEVLVEGGTFAKGRRVVITLTPDAESGAIL